MCSNLDFTEAKQAKSEQGYTEGPSHRLCVTCLHFRTDMVASRLPNGGTLFGYTNLHCAIGGFTVRQMAQCKLWEKLRYE